MKPEIKPSHPRQLLTQAQIEERAQKRGNEAREFIRRLETRPTGTAYLTFHGPGECRHSH